MEHKMCLSFSKILSETFIVLKRIERDIIICMYIGLHIKYPFFISTITIITRHELGLDIPVSASSNSLFQGLPSRLRPFGP